MLLHMDSVKFVPPGGHRACLSCSAAKAKCVYPDDGSVGGSRDGALGNFASGPDITPDGADIFAAATANGVPAYPRCERCERLDRDCLLPVRPRKKRRVGPLKPGTSRVATDAASRDIADLAGVSVAPVSSDVSVSATTYAVVVPPYAGTSGSGSGRPTPTPPPKMTPTPTPPLRHLAPSLPPSPAASMQPNAPTSLALACLRMEGQEADRTLRFYQGAFADFHPIFKLISSSTRAADLQANKPALWLAIVFATSYHDLEYQGRLARSIISYYSEQLFQQCSRKLELLQGVLVFLNCFTTLNYRLPMTTTLLHMAMSLVTDLGLDRLEFSKTADRSPLDVYASVSFHGATQRAPEQGHTVDERIALAVCYCLTNSISAGITSTTPLQYTMQLEDTCRLFEAGQPTKDAAADRTDLASSILAISVRMHYLIRRVLRVRQEAELRDGRFLTPVHDLIYQYLAELDHLFGAVTPEVRSNIHVRLLYHTVEIHIYKISLADISGPSTDDSASSSSASDGPFDSRIRCFMACASFFEVFLSIPVSVYYYVPITTFAQLVHADVTLAMLTAYYRGNAHPPGLPEGVTLPVFDDVMEAMAVRFQKARFSQHPLGFEIRNIAFDSFAARFRSFKLLGLTGHWKAAAEAYVEGTAKHPPHSWEGVTSGLNDVVTQADMRDETPPTNVRSDSPPDVRMEGTPESTIPTADVSGIESGLEQTEWWSWFEGFRTTLLSKAAGNSVTSNGAGSGSGAAKLQRRSGSVGSVGSIGSVGSVGSIGSLLNSSDQEPDYYAYIQQRPMEQQQRQQRQQQQLSHYSVLQPWPQR